MSDFFFYIGPLNVPLVVLTVTTRMLPSGPECSSVMTATGHCNGVVMSSFKRITSPDLKLGV
jgi:hypothetical protein